MLNKFIPFLAFRYFRAKKNEKFVSIISAISLAGISIGVAALIVVMSVMNGFHIELTSNIVGLNGDINITSLDKIIKKPDELSKKIADEKSIKRIIPIISGQALAVGVSSSSGVIIKGIDIKDLKYKGEILNNVIEGDFANYHGNNVIAVGSELAYNLGLFTGMKIKLIAPNILPTVFGSMPRSKEFTVVSIFNSGLYDYDAAVMLMPLDAARKFLSISEGVNLVEVSLNNPNIAQKYSRTIQKKLAGNFRVNSWIQDHQQFLNALKIERTAMFVILSLIITVAAFNIVSSLFMMVKDKNKDIAILRTMGASTKQIMLIFIYNGMLTGFLGTLIGTLLGLSFAYNIEKIRQFLETLSGFKIFDPAIYFLYNLPSVVELSDILLIASMTLILSFLATIYPAYKASILNPVETMRYE